MKPSNQKIKRQRAKIFNTSYITEQNRLRSMTPEERRYEITKQAVQDTIESTKPQINELVTLK